MAITQLFKAGLWATYTAVVVTFPSGTTAQSAKKDATGKSAFQRLEDLQRELKADGWHQTSPLAHYPNRKVVAVLKDGKKRPVKEAILRISWQPVMPLIEIPAGKPWKASWRIQRGKPTVYRFESGSQTIQESCYEAPAKLIPSTEERADLTERMDPEPFPRKIVRLQLMAELVEKGRVTGRWYLLGDGSIVFEKRMQSPK